MSASYCGGVDPNFGADVKLGMKDDAFYSSYRGWCTVMCTVGRVSDMDAIAAAWMAVCMVGFPSLSCRQRKVYQWVARARPLSFVVVLP